MKKFDPINQRLQLGQMAGAVSSCIFCQIAHNSTSTTLLHSQPTHYIGTLTKLFGPRRMTRLSHFKISNLLLSGGRHYLVIPVEHISTVRNLQSREEDYTLVNHMLSVGKMLLHRDAPQSKEYRFGFHQPPLNSVDHLHLHCLALPFQPTVWIQ
ncbi:bifunctional adenosine 5'-phosphosulfate phosphorylase/adenylylsulfatase HINT4 isoform X3 [Manihot esculenta]|uniref:bifunctional adenosine 5'-phosphosulfate phosphorylase/adenylylsulfatase HINT4 isoform X3 n=1 Tax=Manihot esculenta TaxID=3983 RepID=UPI001CC64BFD|nr:bifunctional adenosine 5'-phosphosulfate phosphorylase/adenylylsulfatase HINT4 isoform X3 [Manihot esculenta]XP_043809890.1 bifunctional adenosine 5'-phosphosulfate phosphorylase/adenylylsulfatase HINT4 isoform X3 [Manihot esculenta]XP_043809891.1 bifunctional adenosine 5'-phosphosulfate phosphorylase/adenylylsulfatase HINT4 isoform X3 [Manihot esculenta]XP_043809892.1 bifunctional adenosine 5'-phosphosulfate phosphorylase/adenylylsulfatase HINT4 isoform X3 [Manihot esculenta]XP_043809893.1 